MDATIPPNKLLRFAISLINTIKIAEMNTLMTLSSCYSLCITEAILYRDETTTRIQQAPFSFRCRRKC